MRLTPPGSRTRRTTRTAVVAALLALTGAATLATTSTASAAPAASSASAASANQTATLTVTVPAWQWHDGRLSFFAGLRIDDGASVTCVGDQNTEGTSYNTGEDGTRILYNTSYRINAGTTYRISAWNNGRCDAGTNPKSLGGVTVTPTSADVSSGVYRTRIG